jgi:hypothetical protein
MAYRRETDIEITGKHASAKIGINKMVTLVPVTESGEI